MPLPDCRSLLLTRNCAQRRTGRSQPKESTTAQSTRRSSAPARCPPQATRPTLCSGSRFRARLHSGTGSSALSRCSVPSSTERSPHAQVQDQAPGSAHRGAKRGLPRSHENSTTTRSMEHGMVRASKVAWLAGVCHKPLQAALFQEHAPRIERVDLNIYPVRENQERSSTVTGITFAVLTGPLHCVICRHTNAHAARKHRAVSTWAAKPQEYVMRNREIDVSGITATCAG
eukprot:1405562-Rhodomonas_salina.2